MSDKLLVLLITEKDFKERLSKIVTDHALHTSPQNIFDATPVVDGIWNLLLSLNDNEEETDGKGN